MHAVDCSPIQKNMLYTYIRRHYRQNPTPDAAAAASLERAGLNAGACAIANTGGQAEKTSCGSFEKASSSADNSKAMMRPSQSLQLTSHTATPAPGWQAWSCMLAQWTNCPAGHSLCVICVPTCWAYGMWAPVADHIHVVVRDRTVEASPPHTRMAHQASQAFRAPPSNKQTAQHSGPATCTTRPPPTLKGQKVICVSVHKLATVRARSQTRESH